KVALGTAAFWLISVAFLVNGLGQSGIVQNQVPHLEDIGFPVTIAVTALGVVGLGSTIGKFVFGWLCDRIPVKYACAIGLTFQATGVIIFMSVGSTSSTAMVLLYAIFMGLGVGSWLPTLSMLVSTTFGLASYGAIFGLGSSLLYGASAVGPLLAAYIYDTTNTYHWAFLIFLVAYVISILIVLAVRRPEFGSR
ncbi:MFS transporter, partial [Chloroflexota bacterium]